MTKTKIKDLKYLGSVTVTFYDEGVEIKGDHISATRMINAALLMLRSVDEENTQDYVSQMERLQRKNAPDEKDDDNGVSK